MKSNTFSRALYIFPPNMIIAKHAKKIMYAKIRTVFWSASAGILPIHAAASAVAAAIAQAGQILKKSTLE